MKPNASTPLGDRIVERRRAVALARHYREAEGLTIAQIAEHLGRSPATIKAYFYDPTGITAVSPFSDGLMAKHEPAADGSDDSSWGESDSALPRPPAGSGRLQCRLSVMVSLSVMSDR